MHRPRNPLPAVLLACWLALAGCVSTPAPAPAPATVAPTAEIAATALQPAAATDAPAATAPLAAPTASATMAAAPAGPDGGGIITPEPPTEAAPTVAPTEAAPTSTAATATAAPTAAGPAAGSTSPQPSTTVSNTAFSTDPNPLQITVMRQQSYPGSEITFEQTLDPGANYSRYVVSYRSDGYKIYALMTIPNGPRPANGWPAIIFNHGYIPPTVYRTTERYVAYVDMIARAGYIVFKSDYRGHGSSEGPTTGGGYGGPGYTDDVLNALASVKAYKDTDPNRIGMWGHSMGGQLTLRAMVISKDIKVGVIWGGVVAPYPDIFARGNNPQPFRSPGEPVPNNQRAWRQQLQAKYGTREQNPAFWDSISPNAYLADLTAPIQLHHSVTDEEVPVASSQTLAAEMKAAGKYVELYTYPGDNHNINANFNTAMSRSIAFFDKYLKP